MDAVPFEVPSAEIAFVMMTAAVDGRQVRVLFDTGDAEPFAILLGAGTPAARKARPTGEPPLVTHAVVGGPSASLTPATVASFRLGPILLEGVSVGLSRAVDQVSQRTPGGFDAVVGYELVSRCIVAVDYGRRSIDFAGAPGAADRAVAMTVTPGRPLSVVEARINGRGPFRLAIDTGAFVSLLSPDAAARAGIGGQGAKLRLGGAGGTDTVGRATRADLEVGAKRWPAIRVVVADVFGPISEEAGLEVDGVLGAPQLAHGRLILDYPGRRVWIGEPAAADQASRPLRR